MLQIGRGFSLKVKEKNQASLGDRRGVRTYNFRGLKTGGKGVKLPSVIQTDESETTYLRNQLTRY